MKATTAVCKNIIWEHQTKEVQSTNATNLEYLLSSAIEWTMIINHA